MVANSGSGNGRGATCIFEWLSALSVQFRIGIEALFRQLIEQHTTHHTHNSLGLGVRFMISSKVTVPRIKQLRQCQEASLFMLACTGVDGVKGGGTAPHVQSQLHVQSKLCSSCCISRKLMVIGSKEEANVAFTTSRLRQLNFWRRMLIFNYYPKHAPSHTLPLPQSPLRQAHTAYVKRAMKCAEIYYKYKVNAIKHN